MNLWANTQVRPYVHGAKEYIKKSELKKNLSHFVQILSHFVQILYIQSIKN